MKFSPRDALGLTAIEVIVLNKHFSTRNMSYFRLKTSRAAELLPD